MLGLQKQGHPWFPMPEGKFCERFLMTMEKLLASGVDEMGMAFV
jgi:hypothetical protein